MKLRTVFLKTFVGHTVILSDDTASRAMEPYHVNGNGTAPLVLGLLGGRAEKNNAEKYSLSKIASL